MVICEIGNIQNIEKAFMDYYKGSFVQGVPQVIVITFIWVLCLSLVTFLFWKGFRRGLIMAVRVLLLEFLMIIYCSTVICRKTSDYYKYDFHPLWSYKAIAQGQTILLAENMMNVLVFIPVGLLLGMGFPKISWRILIGIGCMASVTIEIFQFIFKRGFSEIDDVINNTLGCMIGYGVYLIVSKCVSKVKSVKRSEQFC